MTKRKNYVLHGGKGTPLYSRWKNMKTRCYNKNREYYKNYGGRGIKVCDEWKNSFINFRTDMEESFLLHYEKHGSRQTQLDRIDNNKGYNKDNCKWSTMLEQAQNTRNVRLLTCGNETHSLSQWAKIRGISAPNLFGRVHRNLSPEEILYRGSYKIPTRVLSLNGESKTISQWAKDLNFSTTTIRKRLEKGWSIEEALTPPEKVGRTHRNLTIN